MCDKDIDVVFDQIMDLKHDHKIGLKALSDDNNCCIDYTRLYRFVNSNGKLDDSELERISMFYKAVKQVTEDMF